MRARSGTRPARRDEGRWRTATAGEEAERVDVAEATPLTTDAEVERFARDPAEATARAHARARSHREPLERRV